MHIKNRLKLLYTSESASKMKNKYSDFTFKLNERQTRLDFPYEWETLRLCTKSIIS